MTFLRGAAIVVLVALILALVGCAGRRVATHQRQSIFIEDEYAPYGEAGTSTIVGQAFVTAEDGETKYGAGSAIYLNPVTTYSTEWFEVGILQGKHLSEADSRVWRFHREATADEMGRFKFTGLAAGEYYLATAINWEVAGKKTGVLVGAKVEVGEGETAEVTLTQ
jgi:hypothetical protein